MTTVIDVDWPKGPGSRNSGEIPRYFFGEYNIRKL